jgi:hypothetical protein
MRATDGSEPPFPEWVAVVPHLALVTFIAASVILVWRSPGGRWFAAVFAAANCIPMTLAWMLSAMAISGYWL